MKEIDQNPYHPMPRGTVFSGYGAISDITKDLLVVAAFLQSLSLFGSNVLLEYEDWWEHDGLHFKRGSTDLHALFSVLTSPRALIESMSDDDHVFAGLGPEDESWYLRYRADWNSNNEALVAAYGIALTDSLALRFRAEVAAKLICAPAEERSHEYFKRIVNGECTI
jgi:hypothetical protein